MPYVGTLYTKAGDEVLHKYTTPTATPSTPKGGRLCIQGVRTTGGGAPGQFQEEEVNSPDTSVHKLAAQVKKLCKENIELRDRNADP
ncbi:hypothetical protein OsI_15118 [Oryza sativa Indica Group]|uniref:Uncharacterized protein n=1 Tax=Oryza sativa subsp. indica TaxID=39946 RepID=A2XR52_ORYSI|nr:hypothetical protein OsI_15118 [Oryza sativa Indica Group]